MEDRRIPKHSSEFSLKAVSARFTRSHIILGSSAPLPSPSAGGHSEESGQLGNSLPGSLANPPASSGVRSFHSLPHFSMARPLRSLRQIPLPHPALEATRWHFLPTVGAATSRLPALPVLPPKGASLIIPNRQLSGRASGNADNYFLIIARDNNNYRHCLRAALGSHLRSVSPCPTLRWRPRGGTTSLRSELPPHGLQRCPCCPPRGHPK